MNFDEALKVGEGYKGEGMNFQAPGERSDAELLDAIATRVHEANRKWWTDIDTGEYPIKRNFGELMMLATSELAEALEGDRKDLMDDKLPQYHMRDVEIVDCFIRLFDIVGAYTPKFGEIFEAKMDYNATREDPPD